MMNMNQMMIRPAPGMQGQNPQAMMGAGGLNPAMMMNSQM